MNKEELDNINYRHEDMDDRFILKDSGKRQEFNTGAVRDIQDKKPRYDLIPPHSLKRLANVYTKGALKYSDRNWEKGISFQRCIASALRHIEAFRLGINDEDHLGQAAWNLFAIMEFQDLGRNDLDDMIKYEKK